MPKEVLIVNGDSDIRELAAIVLETDGYSVWKMETVEDAITFLKEPRGKEVGALLVDLPKPTEEAIAKIRKITQSKEARGLPTLLMTTGSPAEIGLTSASHDNILYKPFNVVDLLEGVRKLFEPEIEQND